MKKLFLLLFLLLFSFSLHAEDSARAQPLGERFGVQIKEARTTDADLKQIKEAGLKYVRFVIPWAAIEKQKGRYLFSAFDGIMERLKENKLNAIIVLGGGNPYYTKWIKLPSDNIDRAEKTLAAPKTEEQIKAFVSYAKEVTRRYNRDGIIWEIWNEPDSDRFWPPASDVDAYINLASATCHAMREENKNIRIIGPGMADTPGRFGHLLPGFLGNVLKSNLGTCFDGISVHPYRDGAVPPETVLSAYDKLKKYMRAFLPEKEKRKPVFSTEWGFTLTQVTEKQQADFLLRSFLLNLVADIPVSIWYEWRDQWEGEDDPEAHFGLLTLDKKEKESYRVLKAFLEPLKKARFLKRISLGDDDCFALSIKDPEEGFGLIFWSTRDEKDIILENKTNLLAKERPAFTFFGKTAIKPLFCKNRS